MISQMQFGEQGVDDDESLVHGVESEVLEPWLFLEGMVVEQKACPILLLSIDDEKVEGKHTCP